MIYFIALVIVYFLHVLLKLNWVSTLVLTIFSFLVLPMHRKRYEKAKENHKKFLAVSLYLDTILYSFVKEEKVELAIRDVSQTLPDGRMKELAMQALEFMTMTFDEVEVLEEALRIIEKEYPCQRIKDVHKFMTHVEYYGGEIEKPINLLLADKSRWEKRIQTAIAQRKKQLTDIILSVVASLVICGAIVYLPIMEMDISGETIVQILAVFVVIANDFVILKAQKMATADWISVQLTEDDDYFVKKMEDFMTYDEKKEKRLSMLLGMIGSVLSLILFIWGKEWLVVISLMLTLLFMNQHKVGRMLMKRTLIREIKYAFPNWLLDLVLLLQSENVHIALQKSREHVPGVLRKELYLLTENLKMQPESSAPYHSFLREFAIPEVNSAMGILYSLSIGNSANADKQIGELVEKNLELLDVTEGELLKNASSGMYVLFLTPVLVASFKLVFDMMIFMLKFVQIPVM